MLTLDPAVVVVAAVAYHQVSFTFTNRTDPIENQLLRYSSVTYGNAASLWLWQHLPRTKIWSSSGIFVVLIVGMELAAGASYEDGELHLKPCI